MSLEVIQIKNSEIDEKNTITTDKKNSKKSEKITQDIRKFQINTCLKSIEKISTCLNGKSSTDIASTQLDKVCFMIINSYEDKNKDLGQGQLNNEIIISLNYHRFGYKIFYLYNPKSDEFIKFLGYFLQNTTESLTVFYSGLDSINPKVHDIEFVNGSLPSKIVGDVISHNINETTKVIFITDSYNGGTVFDISSLCSFFSRKNTKVVSFAVSSDGKKKQKTNYKKSHGIFINYFCKIMCDCPSITPKLLVEKINPSIQKFNKNVKLEVTSRELANTSLFSK